MDFNKAHNVTHSVLQISEYQKSVLFFYPNYGILKAVKTHQIFKPTIMRKWPSKKKNEHKSNENSALFRHSFLTGHEINYSNPKILATDDNFFRLQIEETLKIKELGAYKSLNGNTGSFRLNLW